MSVYIDKLPTSCEGCPCNDDDYRCGTTGDIFDESCDMGRMKNCPLKLAEDFVEVVRCKDCKWWNNDMPDITYCAKTVWFGTDKDDFCSFGERKKK